MPSQTNPPYTTETLFKMVSDLRTKAADLLFNDGHTSSRLTREKSVEA